MNGTIPTSIGTFRSLRTLDLGLNSLTGTVPFKQLSEGPKSLNFLDLSFNSLLGAPLEYPLKSLKYLRLGHNHFDGRLPTTLYLMTALKVANFDFNLLHGNDISYMSSVFSSMLSLRDFSVDSNNLSGPLTSIIDAISAASGLTRLILNGNQFTGYIGSSISKV